LFRRQWQKQVAAKPRTLTGAEVRSQQPLDADLSCPICKKLVWEAVRVPCCDTAFCEECITNHLLEHDFECPACESRVASLDKLRADEGLRERVRGYVDEEIERSRREEDEERERDKDKEKAEGEEGEDKVGRQSSTRSRC
jgi:protein MPE1